MNAEDEFKMLDSALSYWGDNDLHIILKKWFEIVKGGKQCDRE